MTTHKPVFYDEGRDRWRRTRRVSEIASALLTGVLILFLVNVSRRLDLPRLMLPDSRPTLHAIHDWPRPQPQKRTRRARRVLPQRAAEGPADPLRAAFYVSWDPASFASLKQHHAEIDLLITESLHVTTADGRCSSRPTRSSQSGWRRAAATCS